jgi:hypothetical protein
MPVVLRMQLDGANPEPIVKATEELPGKSNYFIGNDPGKWRTNIPSYAKVLYSGVYPGIDVMYYGNGSQLEYDFVVNPGADPNVIGMRFEGSEGVSVGPDGDLDIEVRGNQLRLLKPVAYQGVKGQAAEVLVQYLRLDDGRVVLKIGSYDIKKALIIDPVLIYSSYLAGSGAEPYYGGGIAVDGSGNAYVTGGTSSIDFPTANPLKAAIADPYFPLDAFVTKLNAAGSALVYST